MQYMVIERHTHGPEPIYRRAAERGRILPEGLHYVDSWVVDDERLDRCFRLMETDGPSLFDEWISHGSDLGAIEVTAVIDSAAAAARVKVGWSGAS